MAVAPARVEISDDISNIAKYRALLGEQGGPGTQNRFFVVVTPPAALSAGADNFADLSFLCEVAEYPGRSFITTGLRTYGPTYQVPHRVAFEPLDVIFQCRDYMTERYAFDEWMQFISPANNYDFAYPIEYEGTVSIYHVTQTNDTSYYKYTLQYAYPVTVSKQPLVWAEQEVQRLAVTFMYKQWVRENLDIPLSND